MKILFNVIFILFLFINSVHSEEETTTKQFDDWQLLCVKVEKKERCEINQLITVESNIQFKLTYQILKNEKTKKKFDAFSIITPLGVNLTKQAALIFPNSEEQINLTFIRCETFGCILTVNDASENAKDNELFDLLKKKLLMSDEFKLGIGAFLEKPLLIKGSLKGFKKSLKELKQKSS